MRKSVLQTFLAAALVTASAALAQPADFKMQVESGKRMEAAGKLEEAGVHYLSMLDYNQQMPLEMKRIVGRRGVACVVAAFRKKTERGQIDDDMQFTRLVEAYQKMRAVEPKNSAWPYLVATAWAAQGRYVEADHNLKTAMAMQGDGTEPAKRMHAVIAKYAAKDLARLNAMDMAAMRAALQASIYARGSGHSSNYDPHYGDAAAGNRAHWAGDDSAAVRFSNGTATEGDRARYGH